jgi:hypothetical protein
MSQPPTLRLVIRSASGSGNHHIWNNNGIWWCHFSVQDDEGRTRRIRKSLKTRDLQKAREKRDRLLSNLNNASGRLVA